jgi:molybdate transport system ATP-binding protein
MIEVNLSKRLYGPMGDIGLTIDMHIKKGELVTLYGPSGAGKTSVLRMIAGVFTPDKGYINVEDKAWYDHTEKINLKPQQRRVGIVFQDYALFPNMTVHQNICFGLDKNQSAEIAEELIIMMELGQLRDKMPQLLSGGQRQRVALARAIVRRPSLLLLDEPFAALDTELRIRMQEYILTAHKKYALTTILVSHDILEIIRLSDKVFVMENGKISKTGSPTSVIPLDKLRSMLSLLDKHVRDDNRIEE